MPETSEYLVEMTGITKRFPGVLALDNVDFKLKPGEIHMLLGENGAGKSTLIKVLSGAYIAEEGEIRICGEKLTISSPKDPLEKGLRFIYQEVNLVPELDIARNMFLGMEPMKMGLVDKARLYEEAKKYLVKFHIDLDPHEVVGRLSVTQQKMVEIARALVTDAKILVLDEPTDVLEDRSRQDLFQVINDLKRDHQVGFIYISHRYAEVHELGDKVTILRDGRNAGVYDIDDITLEEMIEKMIGGKVGQQYPDLPEPSSESILELKDVRQGKRVNGISLDIKKGEIVSITGLMGAGKTELARAVCGIEPVESGEVLVDGKPVKSRTPSQSIAEGLSYLTEDRKTLGLILPHSIRDNIALPNMKRLSPRGLVKHKEIDREVDEFIKKLQIKTPGAFTQARQLSGGNQQKVVIAKWLGTNSRVLFFDEPTRGIDIKGRAEVYKLMHKLLEDGIGIVMMTSDYTEALEMGHRVLVLHRGKVVKEFKRGEATEEDILKAAVGSDSATA